MRSPSYFVFFGLLILPINVLSSEIYQFIDSSGTIHFTNVPTDPRFKPMNPEETGPIASDKINREEIEVLINEASKTQGLSPALIKAVIRAESNFNSRAVSSAGAQGLMQLMPGTAEDLRLGNPFDPEENIHGGTRYLRYLLDRFDQDLRLAIAAYHAGPGTVSRHGGVPPIEKTEHYLKKVLRFYEFYLGEAERENTRKKTKTTKNLRKKVFARSGLSFSLR